jgi:hypothetical protein
MDQQPRRHLVTFGAVMLILGGVFNVLDGVTALTTPEHFHDDPLIATLTAWGWIFAAWGALEVGLGIAVLRGSQIALWPGIAVVGLNALMQLANVADYPAWSITIVVVDVLVIYAFSVQGLETGTTTVDAQSEAPADAERVLTPSA